MWESCMDMLVEGKEEGKSREDRENFFYNILLKLKRDFAPTQQLGASPHFPPGLCFPSVTKRGVHAI